MNVLFGVLAAVISAALTASKDVWFKDSVGKTGVFKLLFYSSLIFWIPITAYFLATGGHSFTFFELQAGAIVGVGLLGGYFLYFKSLEAGNVSLVGPLSELWSVFTAIAAVSFLGERLSAIQVAGIVFASAGLFIVSTKRDTAKLNAKALFYALSSAIVWGFTWFMVKPLVDSAGVIPAIVLYEGVGAVILLAYGLVTNKIRGFEKTLVLPSLFGLVAYVVETWGIMVSTVSLVSVVFSPAYVLVLIPASAFFLHEKLERRHYAGIAMLLLGLILITLG